MKNKILFRNLAIIVGAIVLVVIIGYLFWQYQSNKSQKTNNTYPSEKPSSDIQTGAMYIETKILEAIQESTSKGENLDYLDPVGAARIEGQRYGFLETDSFKLEQKNWSQTEDNYIAVVVATHKGIDYDLILMQPVIIGDGGIWTITSVEKKDSTFSPN